MKLEMRRNLLLIRIKKTLRKLNALNLLLITAFSSLVYLSYDILSSSYEPDVSKNVSKEKISETPTPVHLTTLTADFDSFDTVLKNNLFRPERSEYVKPVAVNPPPPPPPPLKPGRRLPKPDLTLDGVLLSGSENKTALISGHYFTPRARVNLKQQRHKEGDLLGSYKITEIDSRAVTLRDEKTDEKLTLSLKFSGFTGRLAQRRSRPVSGARPATRRPPVPRQSQRMRAARGVSSLRRQTSSPAPPNIQQPERHNAGRTRGVQTIPAVYSGGRVYYPKHGSPPPQRISGDLSPVDEQYPAGN